MATKNDLAPYQWLRPFGFGLVALLLGIVTTTGAPAIGMLIGILGVGLVVYSLFKRDRDRRALSGVGTRPGA